VNRSMPLARSLFSGATLLVAALLLAAPLAQADRPSTIEGVKASVVVVEPSSGRVPRRFSSSAPVLP
jgi:hypothetical protein